MRLLLDTHTLYWWFMESPRLSVRAANAISDEQSTVFVSAVTAFEIAYKVRQDKWPEAAPRSSNFSEAVMGEGFQPLALSWDHARLAGEHITEHKDPFDRMLLAQAEFDDLIFATADRVLQSITRTPLW